MVVGASGTGGNRRRGPDPGAQRRGPDSGEGGGLDCLADHLSVDCLSAVPFANGKVVDLSTDSKWTTSVLCDCSQAQKHAQF